VCHLLQEFAIGCGSIAAPDMPLAASWITADGLRQGDVCEFLGECTHGNGSILRAEVGLALLQGEAERER
jgi:hypothetical protein